MRPPISKTTDTAQKPAINPAFEKFKKAMGKMEITNALAELFVELTNNPSLLEIITPDKVYPLLAEKRNAIGFLPFDYQYVDPRLKADLSTYGIQLGYYSVVTFLIVEETREWRDLPPEALLAQISKKNTQANTWLSKNFALIEAFRTRFNDPLLQNEETQAIHNEMLFILSLLKMNLDKLSEKQKKFLLEEESQRLIASSSEFPSWSVVIIKRLANDSFNDDLDSSLSSTHKELEFIKMTLAEFDKNPVQYKLWYYLYCKESEGLHHFVNQFYCHDHVDAFIDTLLKNIINVPIQLSQFLLEPLNDTHYKILMRHTVDNLPLFNHVVLLTHLAARKEDFGSVEAYWFFIRKLLNTYPLLEQVRFISKNYLAILSDPTIPADYITLSSTLLGQTINATNVCTTNLSPERSKPSASTPDAKFLTIHKVFGNQAESRFNEIKQNLTIFEGNKRLNVSNFAADFWRAFLLVRQLDGEYQLLDEAMDYALEQIFTRPQAYPRLYAALDQRAETESYFYPAFKYYLVRYKDPEHRADIAAHKSEQELYLREHLTEELLREEGGGRKATASERKTKALSSKQKRTAAISKEEKIRPEISQASAPPGKTKSIYAQYYWLLSLAKQKKLSQIADYLKLLVHKSTPWDFLKLQIESQERIKLGDEYLIHLENSGRDPKNLTKLCLVNVALNSEFDEQSALSFWLLYLFLNSEQIKIVKLYEGLREIVNCLINYYVELMRTKADGVSTLEALFDQAARHDFFIQPQGKILINVLTDRLYPQLDPSPFPEPLIFKADECEDDDEDDEVLIESHFGVPNSEILTDNAPAAGGAGSIEANQEAERQYKRKHRRKPKKAKLHNSETAIKESPERPESPFRSNARTISEETQDPTVSADSSSTDNALCIRNSNTTESADSDSHSSTAFHELAPAETIAKPKPIESARSLRAEFSAFLEEAIASLIIRKSELPENELPAANQLIERLNIHKQTVLKLRDYLKKLQKSKEHHTSEHFVAAERLYLSKDLMGINAYTARFTELREQLSSTIQALGQPASALLSHYLDSLQFPICMDEMAEAIEGLLSSNQFLYTESELVSLLLQSSHSFSRETNTLLAKAQQLYNELHYYLSRFPTQRDLLQFIQRDIKTCLLLIKNTVSLVHTLLPNATSEELNFQPKFTETKPEADFSIDLSTIDIDFLQRLKTLMQDWNLSLNKYGLNLEKISHHTKLFLPQLSRNLNALSAQLEGYYFSIAQIAAVEKIAFLFKDLAQVYLHGSLLAFRQPLDYDLSLEFPDNRIEAYLQQAKELVTRAGYSITMANYIPALGVGVLKLKPSAEESSQMPIDISLVNAHAKKPLPKPVALAAARVLISPHGNNGRTLCSHQAYRAISLAQFTIDLSYERTLPNDYTKLKALTFILKLLYQAWSKQLMLDENAQAIIAELNQHKCNLQALKAANPRLAEALQLMVVQHFQHYQTTENFFERSAQLMQFLQRVAGLSIYTETPIVSQPAVLMKIDREKKVFCFATNIIVNPNANLHFPLELLPYDPQKIIFAAFTPVMPAAAVFQAPGGPALFAPPARGAGAQPFFSPQPYLNQPQSQ